MTVSRPPLEHTSIADGQRLPNAAIFVKRTTVEFLQIMFGTRPVGDYRYDPDDTKTEIQICDQHTVNLDAVDVRPAIIAVRGPISWMGNQGLGGSAVEGRDMQTGKEIYNDLLTGSVAFSCLSREGLETENLAHLVFNSFKFFRRALQKHGFFSIKSLNIGSETLVEQEGSDDKLYLVPVYVSVSVQERWSLDDVTARKLQKIIIESMIGS